MKNSGLYYEDAGNMYAKIGGGLVDSGSFGRSMISQGITRTFDLIGGAITGGITGDWNDFTGSLINFADLGSAVNQGYMDMFTGGIQGLANEGRLNYLLSRAVREAEGVGSDFSGRNVMFGYTEGGAESRGRDILLRRALLTSGRFGDILNTSTILGWEQMRSGNVDGNNKAETVEAAKNRLETAKKLAEKYGTDFISRSPELLSMFLAQSRGEDYFSSYISANYDSSKDYWKMVEKNGQLLLIDDGNQDIVDKDGKILISHNKELLDKIQKKESEINDLFRKLDSDMKTDPSAGDSPEFQKQYKQLATELKRLQVTYNYNPNYNNKGVASSRTDLLANLLMGRGQWQGFSGGTDVSVLWSQLNSNKSSGEINATNLFLNFKGFENKREFLGNKNNISDILFNNIHRNSVEGTIINFMRGYVSQDKQFIESQVKNETIKNARELFGLNNEGYKEYNKRLNKFINSQNDFINQKIDFIKSYNPLDYDQIAMAKSLKWGWNTPTGNYDPENYPDAISQLCNALSYVAQHDLNTMTRQGFDKIKDFLEDAKDKLLINNYGGINGYENTIGFIRRYSKLYGTTPPLNASTEIRYGNTFDVGSNPGNSHRSVILENDSLFMQPYNSQQFPNLYTDPYHFYLSYDYYYNHINYDF
ncbi:MAG: hypothetical protein A2163_00625 [Actinobacteria bacterium RBG_13_35_12]|nr:MAG: hypothetical protein A2163_00625 [Actinobacteria bacterium RBG_13_35_12]